MASITTSPALLHRTVAPAPEHTPVAVPPRLSYAEQDRRTTATLAKLTGAGVLVILALFITMMTVLGGYGPAY